MSVPEDRALWLEYVEWSATRISERLLALSVDELWSLAQRTPTGRALAPHEIPADLLPPPGSAGYLDLVRNATLAIAGQLDLPSFPDWKRSRRGERLDSIPDPSARPTDAATPPSQLP